MTPLAEPLATTEGRAAPTLATPRVTVCGTFRRDHDQLVADYHALIHAGCVIVSPTDIDFVDEKEGFVFALGERDDPPARIEGRHLGAMLAADFIWLHAPDGYIGHSAAMELGFAHAHRLAVFARHAPTDPAFRGLVTVVDSPAAGARLAASRAEDAPVERGLSNLQHYYQRVAQARGYDAESAQDCMLLLTEEIGELARAVRKHVGLARDSGYAGQDPVSTELADVQLYILHLANVMSVDLAEAVVSKERVNAQRHVASELSQAA